MFLTAIKGRLLHPLKFHMNMSEKMCDWGELPCHTNDFDTILREDYKRLCKIHSFFEEIIDSCWQNSAKNEG